MNRPSSTVPSLRTLIVIVFGGFAAVLAIVLCLLGGEVLRLRLQQQAAQALRMVAHNTAIMLQQDLLQQIRRTEVIARSQELWQDGLDAPSVGLMLNRIHHINPHNVWLGVADTHGTIRNASNHLLLGHNVSERPWFQQALRGPAIGDVHPAKLLAPLLPASNSEEPLRFVDFSAPIHNLQGQLLGVIGIQSSWDWVREGIEKLLRGSAPNDQQSIFIFDQQGTLIYAPDGALAPYAALGQRLPSEVDPIFPQPVLAHWRDDPQAFLTVAERLPAPTDDNDLGWWIVARQPAQTAYADAHRVLMAAFALAAASALLAMVVAWRLAKHVIVDLKILVSAAEQFPSTQGNTPIPILRSTREVQQLSQALHDMTQQLLHANAHMQEQVQQRTLELQQANGELERLASTDSLTKLLNRRGFHVQADWAFALAQRSQLPLSMISLDIDFFKRINDNYGHDIGDVVLSQLATLLQQHTRYTDICTRYGGEEFLVLLPDTDLDTAVQLAQMLLHTVETTPMPPVGHITVSAGVSSLRHTEQDDSMAQLIKRSDEAMYEAKQTGRNRVCKMA